MYTMRMLFDKGKQTASVFGVLMILLIVVLSGCGNTDSSNSSGGSSTTTGGSNSTAAQPTPTSIAGYGTTQGCPSDTVVGNAPKANETVVMSGTTDATVIAHTGDIIEFRFPFGKRWIGPKTMPAQLQIQKPAGYALKSDKVCVWRFIAQSAGTVELHFSSRALCKAGGMCPLYILDVPVTVAVK
ncbi:hypothetical protein [Dictyobacter kobayashii]|uniref:Uncharacterized protein n=1 Tax=Dictyobacter kobayashii TaxID=2014872 RepID=A0A402AGK0_9CHLR|nr:hypothetical protein [Dictyobacter kobayashii]GCE18174.1 hypothetical protein KDK_19740 [Dictyobacter kobayashii]